VTRALGETKAVSGILVQELPGPSKLNDIVVADAHANSKSVAHTRIEDHPGSDSLEVRFNWETHAASVTDERVMSKRLGFASIASCARRTMVPRGQKQQ
jgi:hypothetical protein